MGTADKNDGMEVPEPSVRLETQPLNGGGIHVHQGTMLNAYPDSIGKNMSGMIAFLKKAELKDAFRSFYLLPTAFNTDLDRGFSVISYDLCPSLVTSETLKELRDMNIDLTFDFILNHLSVLSPQFQDILRKGDQSVYRDFFIDWNRFWSGCGDKGEDGVVRPGADDFLAKNLRKAGLPILMVRLPDGRDVPYWNTFYQKVIYPELSVFDVLEMTGYVYEKACALCEWVNARTREGKRPEEMDWGSFAAYRQPVLEFLNSHRHYLGQMDLNVQSPMVWAWYDQTLEKLSAYGASLIRLDAFTRLHKARGRTNFMNEPETWDILGKIREMAAARGLEVLPEIHAAYNTGAYRKLADLGCPVYDYFLPALLLDALDTGDPQCLYDWAVEQIRDGIMAINMLGCHDGIPIRDPHGLVPDERMDALTERLVSRGGRKKMLHGVKPEVYQIDMTYYSALSCDDRKLALARAVQMFMPGKPQVWYVDLLAGKNDEDVFIRDPSADNREMNRHCYSMDEALDALRRPVVQEQIELLRLRNTHPAFSSGARITVKREGENGMHFRWENGASWVELHVNFSTLQWKIDRS